MQRLLLALAALLFSAAAHAENYSDMWFNPSESGWGVTIADHDTQLFAVWYAYDTDGSPTWFTGPGGTFNANRTFFSGDVYRSTGPYVYHAPNTLLPCCASERPHPDSAAFHQRSVRSRPQAAGELPKGRRWMRFERGPDPTLYEKKTVPGGSPAGAKSNEAVPTFVRVTAAGLNGAAYDGPVLR